MKPANLRSENFENRVMASFFRLIPLFLATLPQLYSVPNAQTLQPSAATLLNDEFYKEPPGYERIPLGGILRSRPAPFPIKLVKYLTLKPKAAWQILYRTQNSVGEPEATVVTLLV